MRPTPQCATSIAPQRERIRATALAVGWALAALTALGTLPSFASPPQIHALLGAWKVDLRPTPQAAPYFSELVVSKVHPNNTFEGTFYGAAVSQARINPDWGALRIAFVTTDGSGQYHHAAVLQGKTLEGLTNATGRGFLSVWSAVKP